MNPNDEQRLTGQAQALKQWSQQHPFNPTSPLLNRSHMMDEIKKQVESLCETILQQRGEMQAAALDEVRNVQYQALGDLYLQLKDALYFLEHGRSRLHDAGFMLAPHDNTMTGGDVY